VVEARDDRYSGAHPGPDDIYLLVEVADTSLEYDRTTKLPLYARHGVREVWLVDLRHDVVEVHRDPDADGYRIAQSYRDAGAIRLESLGLEFDYEELVLSSSEDE